MSAEDRDVRRVRAAKNESLIRDVNEQVESLADTNTFKLFVCECFDESCTEQVPLTVEEYEHIRGDPNRFVILPGHLDPEVEEVVETCDRFIVVAKLGAGRRIAEQMDPRANADLRASSGANGSGE